MEDLQITTVAKQSGREVGELRITSRAEGRNFERQLRRASSADSDGLSTQSRPSSVEPASVPESSSIARDDSNGRQESQGSDLTEQAEPEYVLPAAPQNPPDSPQDTVELTEELPESVNAIFNEPPAGFDQLPKGEFVPLQEVVETSRSQETSHPAQIATIHKADENFVSTREQTVSDAPGDAPERQDSKDVGQGEAVSMKVSSGEVVASDTESEQLPFIEIKDDDIADSKLDRSNRNSPSQTVVPDAQLRDAEIQSPTVTDTAGPIALPGDAASIKRLAHASNSRGSEVHEAARTSKEATVAPTRISLGGSAIQGMTGQALVDSILPSEVQLDGESRSTDQAAHESIAFHKNDSTNLFQKIMTGRAAIGLRDDSQQSDGDPRVEVARFVGRVAGAIRVANERGGALQLRLSPPELGAMKLQLIVEGGVLTARIEAETSTARKVLLDNLPALRDRLAQQEIRIERFDVDVRHDGPGTQSNWQAGERNGGRFQANHGQELRDSPKTIESASESERIPIPQIDGRLNVIA